MAEEQSQKEQKEQREARILQGQIQRLETATDAQLAQVIRELLGESIFPTPNNVPEHVRDSYARAWFEWNIARRNNPSSVSHRMAAEYRAYIITRMLTLDDPSQWSWVSNTTRSAYDVEKQLENIRGDPADISSPELREEYTRRLIGGYIADKTSIADVYESIRGRYTRAVRVYCQKYGIEEVPPDWKQAHRHKRRRR